MSTEREGGTYGLRSPEPTRIDSRETLTSVDMVALELSVALAFGARRRGDHPFAAVVADGRGHILVETTNRVLSSRDLTAHAEVAAIRRLGNLAEKPTLAGVTMYASAEPCAMCAGAIGWSPIAKVVYALSRQDVESVTATGGNEARTSLSCRQVLAAAPRPIDVVGPVDVVGAKDVHHGYWG